MFNITELKGTATGPDDIHYQMLKPIPKPGKDHAEPTNYRPIALTSWLCKTLERMINKRLVWYLESNNLITKFSWDSELNIVPVII